MVKIYTVVLCFLGIPVVSFAQQTDSLKDHPKDQRPTIAMINEVWYSNGERYVHPSFEYVATGFLIDTGTDTLAATVKHALWVAKTKSMTTVDLRDLQRWIMHPKGNLKDSVVIDRLINQDTTEVLSGPKSTITQRDWLVFTTKFRSPAIHPLKPRYTTVEVGDTIYFSGCPYAEKSCLTKEAKVLEVEGDRIIFTVSESFNLGGFSGSPLIDKNGYLIGILGGSSFNRKNGDAALYGISTRYLEKVLTNKQPLNVHLIPIDTVINSYIRKKGFKAGIKELRRMIETDSMHYKYDFSMENINRLGDRYKERGEIEKAIEIYKLSAERYSIPATYLKLADSYILANKKKLASDTYRKLLAKWPGNREATEGLHKL
jgi:hypothetical protein